MNGRLHIGHAFSISKAEFASRFERMMGKKVLFPFGFHCTGMPISASADKLKREFEVKEENRIVEEVEEAEENIEITKVYRSGKSKSQSKGKGMKVSEILKSMGIEEENIEKFKDPLEWVKYFPKESMEDLKEFGIGVDWRRSFVTTEINPYYDSFVRWQFLKLKERGRILFGKRNSIYSRTVKQPCLDHDRAKGEGVQPQEYTIVKLKLIEEIEGLEGKEVYLIAATLRAETMYGQTNCWILPEGEYECMEGKEEEVYICSKNSRINISHQELTPEFGKSKIFRKILGKELIGLSLKAPLTPYKIIYILPLETINMEKGTGVVTSVPSDSPDDYRALEDLREDEELRNKYGVKLEWIFEPIEIIEIPELGKLSAPLVCKRMKIINQHDSEKLKEAKKLVYLLGNRDGKMIVGEYEGESVSKVKSIISDLLVSRGEAFYYSEPESKVISRHGDKCIVAKIDQWYIDYGQEEWKETVRGMIKKMETYHEDTRMGLESTTNWLHEWACSRTYGLGTKIPWDEEWLIESLSDSTIYMAYYTISHLLQGDLRGETLGISGLKVTEINEKFWDYIFLNSEEEPEGISKEILLKFRKEFNYWYPMNLRTSGKDLVRNHLTFWLFNHCAIFEEKYWPLGVRANGHVLLDSEKMSKQTGNFITLREAIKEYGADGVRFALADAGDMTEDANFSRRTAEAGVHRLHNQIKWFKKILKQELREGKFIIYDKLMMNEISECIKSSRESYQNMMYRDALKMSFYVLQKARDSYRVNVGGEENMHKEVIKIFINIQVLLMAPITPHWSEYIWKNILLKESSIVNELFPNDIELDNSVIPAQRYLSSLPKLLKFSRHKFLFPGKRVRRNEENLKGCIIKVSKEYSEWQKGILEILRDLYEPENTPDTRKIVQIMKKKGLCQDMRSRMAFVTNMLENAKLTNGKALSEEVPFNELQAIDDLKEQLYEILAIKEIFVEWRNEGDALFPLAEFYENEEEN